MASTSNPSNRGANLSNARETTSEAPEAPEVERQSSEDPEVTMIVHRVNGHDEQGRPKIFEHGPMPVTEWAAYEKKNGL